MMRRVAVLLGFAVVVGCGRDAPRKDDPPSNNGVNNGQTNNGQTNNGNNGVSDAVCGNGVVEFGELCDTGITEGDGACPMSCQAPACHTATLLGNPTTCNAVCTVEPVACMDGDGCCTPGCDRTNDSDCDNLCGDGSVEGPELCDGDCPTSCASPDACVEVTLLGSAATCNSRCQIEPVQACVGGDGCCPASCTALDDNDCGTMCGNGTLEPGETCDGNCPTSCNDNSACTRDRLDGSAVTCNVLCSNEEIRACRSNDGCCPAGCTNDLDSDCSPSCGNGVVDANETCDGNCAVACDDRDACTRNIRRGSDENCNVECVFPPVDLCQSGDGCCPSGCSNANDSDCSCTPSTCSDLGVACGPASNGCGGTIQCGSCPSGSCVQGACQSSADSTVGSACTSDAECADPTLGDSVYCLGPADGFPGGYCSAQCIGLCNDFFNVCASDPNLPFFGSCVRACETNADCGRSGYECVVVSSILGEQRACLPR